MVCSNPKFGTGRNFLFSEIYIIIANSWYFVKNRPKIDFWFNTSSERSSLLGYKSYWTNRTTKVMAVQRDALDPLHF